MLSKSGIILAAGSLLLGLALGWKVENWRMRAEVAEILEAQAKAVAAQVQAIRAEESRRLLEVEDAKAYAEARVAGLEMVVDSADATASELRRELASWRSRRMACPAESASGSPGVEGFDAIGLLIGMLDGLESEGRKVAEYADRLKIAGEVCERTWDKIKGDKTKGGG